MPVLKKIKRNLTVLITKSLVELLNIFPRNFGIFLISWIGLLAWWLDAKDRHRIKRHLTLFYGDKLTEAKKDLIGRNFFINSAKNFVDVVRMQRYYKSEQEALIEFVGLEHYDKALKKGRGMFGVTGHIGNFELMAVSLVAKGYPLGVIGRKMYDERMDKILVGNREALGLKNFYTTDSPRHLLKWLAAGKIIGVLMDTDSYRVRSMMIPSFGRLSHTPVGHIQIALRNGLDLVPTFCIRTKENRYKVIIKPAIEYDYDIGSSDEAIYQVALKCNQAIEKFIQEYPDQWIWLHNRWHTTPEESANY